MVDQIAPPAPADAQAATRKIASDATVRAVLLIAGAVFALAAGAHVLRYLLMLINRTMLLPPFVAIGSLISGVLASLAALVAVAATAVVLTSWLIGRRAAVFARHGQDDPRPEMALWFGCLVPIVNLFFAPLFVVELAHAEKCRERQRRPVMLWVIAWVIATLICAWATWTSVRAHGAQAVADNTVTTIIAYLAGLAVVILLWRVVDGFVSRPVSRPQHRWVVVTADRAEQPVATAEPAAEVIDETGETEAIPAEPASDDESAIESRDREPAA